jgi:hypothetical protein
MSVELLELAAAALGELLEEVVFVGGATVGHWTAAAPSAAPPYPARYQRSHPRFVTIRDVADAMRRGSRLSVAELVDHRIEHRQRRSPLDPCACGA